MTIDDEHCVYPNWDGTYWTGKHLYGSDQDFCAICGHPSKQCQEKNDVHPGRPVPKDDNDSTTPIKQERKT